MSEAVVVREPSAVVEGHQPTPMNMIQLAMAQNVPVDRLQALWELNLQWEKNEARKAYTVAMNKFKESPPVILKSKEVSFGTGKTSYKHATLDNASEQIGEALSKVGISHRWSVEQTDGRIRVTCILTHVLGHSEQVTLEAAPDQSGSKNNIQAVGSTVSYLQRYSLFAATGLASKGADDDARQGVKGLDAGTVADFEAAIEALTDKPSGERLWKQIADACSKAGDVASYETLKSAISKRVKAMPAKEAAL